MTRLCSFIATEVHPGIFEQVCSRCGYGQITTTKRLVNPCKIDAANCAHRGEKVGEQICPTCTLPTRVTIFACARHGQCEIAGLTKDVKFCGDCHEFLAKPPG